jgi:inward rectifier potassium channel
MCARRADARDGYYASVINGEGPKTKRVRFEAPISAGPLVRTKGRQASSFEDIYHSVLRMPWWRFFLFLACTWLGINLVFAMLYIAQPGCVANAAPGDIEDAFYFSVQTFATIGYGAMSPVTRYGHLVVVAEAFVGTLAAALVTGATFAKFARPTARILFSAKAVIHLRDGVPHLVFRLANWRNNMVVAGQLSVMLLMVEKTREGDTLRKPIELPLVRDRTAIFALTWVPMHRIDEKSPFWGGPAAIERLRAAQAELFLSFTGQDETLGQQIHARHNYKLDDIVLNARFVDVLTVEPTGTRVIDYVGFHDVEIVGPADALPWAAAPVK